MSHLDGITVEVFPVEVRTKESKVASINLSTKSVPIACKRRVSVSG